MSSNSPFTTVATTHEQDGTSSAGPTKDTKLTTVGAQTNQYEHAAWNLVDGSDGVVLSLQLYSVNAIVLAIYRVTNDADSSPVTVRADQEDGIHPTRSFTLAPGTSLDLSWENIVIEPIGGAVAHGTYQYINSALAMQPTAQPPKAGAGTGDGGGGGTGAGGGPGGGGGGAGTGSGGGGTGTGGGGTGTGGGTGGGNPNSPPDPNDGLNKLKALEKEAQRIRDKLDIARKYGQKAAADALERLLKLVEERIGRAAIAEAKKEIEQLGGDANALGGGA